MKKKILSTAITILLLSNSTYADNNIEKALDDNLFRNPALFHHQTLQTNDGWGSDEGGTSGGGRTSVGTNTVYVSTWAEFKAAVKGDVSRIVVITQPIHAFGFENEATLGPTCDDFTKNVMVESNGGSKQFRMEDYIAHVAGWTEGVVNNDPYELARVKAANNQKNQVRVSIGSNKTIISDEGLQISGASLYLDGIHNVIIRNLKISDAFDCFPQWDPADGSDGNWNSLYDNITIINKSKNVWIDRVTLDDGKNPPSTALQKLGRKFERHDGLLDISNGSDLVTVSNSIFQLHDKTNLVGSMDNNNRGDEGALRVTWHTNKWIDTGQRTPRLRFGKNDIYNNVYQMNSSTQYPKYQYSLGVGYNSSIYAENNVFQLQGIDASKIISVFNGGKHIRTLGNLVSGVSVDIRSAYNATVQPDKKLNDMTDWTPHLRRGDILPASSVVAWVNQHAGAHAISICDPNEYPLPSQCQPIE